MSGYKTYLDTDLTALLKIGDEHAFAELYNRYWSKLFVHARKMLKDEEQAMDVVQDLFTNLWNKHADLQIRSSIKDYLYGSVRNSIINQINRSKLKDQYLDSLAAFMQQGELQTEQQVNYRDLAARIDEEVNTFSPKMKVIYELSRKEGLSNKEISFELNITDHAVKKTLNRALKRLKTQLFNFFLF